MAAEPGAKDINQYAHAIASTCNISLIAKVVDVVKNDAKISPYAQLGRLIQICDEVSKVPADVKPKLIDVFMCYDPRGCVHYVNRKTAIVEYINKEQAGIIAEQHKEIERLKLAVSLKKRKAESDEPESEQAGKRLVGYDSVVAANLSSSV